MRKEKLDQLRSITVSKRQHINDYFNEIKNLIISTASTISTADALYYLGRFYSKIENEITTEIDINDIKKQVSNHYDNFYLDDINFDLAKNASIARDTKDIALQTDKISKNIVKDTDEKEFQGKENITYEKFKNEALTF